MSEARTIFETLEPDIDALMQKVCFLPVANLETKLRAAELVAAKLIGVAAAIARQARPALETASDSAIARGLCESMLTLLEQNEAEATKSVN